MSFKERMNYTKTQDGKYFGYLVNLPQVSSTADSVEALEHRLKTIALMWLEYYGTALSQELDKVEFETTDPKQWQIKADLLFAMSRKAGWFDHLKNLDIT